MSFPVVSHFFLPSPLEVTCKCGIQVRLGLPRVVIRTKARPAHKVFGPVPPRAHTKQPLHHEGPISGHFFNGAGVLLGYGTHPAHEAARRPRGVEPTCPPCGKRKSRCRQCPPLLAAITLCPGLDCLASDRCCCARCHRSLLFRGRPWRRHRRPVFWNGRLSQVGSD